MGGSTFGFDVESRLTSVSGAASLSATYDGDGLRASKTGSTGQSFFLYDGETPLVELSQSGSILAGNGFGADGWRSRYYPTGSPLAKPSKLDGQYLVYTYDPQGNLVQRQSQSNGTTRALDTAVYDGYGARLGDKDALAGGNLAYKDPVGFGGQHGYYSDPETGMQLLTHRYYDSGRGRFVTRDPIGYNGGIDLYGFVGNNPVNEIDPEGTQSPGSGDPNDDNMARIEHGGGNPFYGKTIHAINRGAGVAKVGAGAIADSLPGVNYAEGAIGKDALGHRLSAGERAVLVIPVFGTVLHRVAAGRKVVKTGAAIFADTDLLVHASRGHAGALAELENASKVYVTPNQLREFLAGGAGRRQFIAQHNIQVYGGAQARSAASSSDFQKVFSAVRAAQGRGDAALLAFARTTGITAVTMERRLFNYATQGSNSVLRLLPVPIRRVLH